MKPSSIITAAAVWLMFLNLAPGAPAISAGGSTKIPAEVAPIFQRFVKEKYDLDQAIAKKNNLQISTNIENFFAAAKRDDWVAASNLFEAIKNERMEKNSGSQRTPNELWVAVQDVDGAYGMFVEMDPKFLEMYGTDMVKGIPPGSVYFGGTDPGRFLVSAFSESHNEGRPFFTLTQNGLVDPDYLGHIARLCGDKINIPDTNESKSFSDAYLADAQARLMHDQMHPNEPHQIKPGEDVHMDATHNLQVSGQVVVMSINALIAKSIFEKNPAKEFYVEESFPLDWMFPHLTPHGLILKINRETLAAISQDTVKADHQFWSAYSERLIGNWITYDTTVKEVAEFAEKVYLHHDLEGFKGDAKFVNDADSQKTYSKLRSSIGGVYCWRLGMPPSGGTMPSEWIAQGTNRPLMEREADFAFKQAFAFCPSSPEAVFRYVQLLVSLRRVDDAMLVAEAAQKLDPHNSQFGYLIQNLKTISAQSGAMNQNRAQMEAEVAKLEKDVEPGSTNFMEQFNLAQKLIQLGHNDRAYEVLDGVVSNPHATLPMVMSVADAYSRLNQPKKLLAALERLTQLAPDSPEAWYDLAALHATMGGTAPALEALKKSLELNSKRLGTNANAKDIRTTLTNDARFSKLRDLPEYKAITPPK